MRCFLVVAMLTAALAVPPQSVLLRADEVIQ
jgi:hypothetical protein